VHEQSGSVRLSKEHKGRARRAPVWIGRYRIVGKDSARVLGKARTKRSRAPEGYLTRAEAEEALRALLVSEGAAVTAAQGVTFDEAADAYLTSLEVRITSGSFRASTLRTYANIIAKELRPRWGDRKIASVTQEEIASYRTLLASRNLAATTLTRCARSCVASSPLRLSVLDSTTTYRSPSSAPRRGVRLARPRGHTGRRSGARGTPGDVSRNVLGRFGRPLRSLRVWKAKCSGAPKRSMSDMQSRLYYHRFLRWYIRRR
jgi:hypothetical protein